MEVTTAAGSWTEEFRRLESQDDFSETLPDRTLFITIFLIITTLVTITICFERLHHFILHEYATPQMKPVVEQLFAEVMILGFLSIITYVIEDVGLLSDLSRAVFGSDDEAENYLDELVEDCHYILFFVMLLFIAQILLLITVGNIAIAKWTQYDQELEFERKGVPYDSAKLAKEEGFCTKCIPTPPSVKNRKLFEDMRAEFIKERDVRSFKPNYLGLLPDNAPEHEKQAKANEFDYGAYLGECISDSYCEMVDLSLGTWLSLEMLVFIVTLYLMVNPTCESGCLGKIFIILDYVVVGLLILWRDHLAWIQKQLIASDSAHAEANASQPLLTPSPEAGLPAWTALPEPVPAKNDFLFLKKIRNEIFGKNPNRLHMLFVFKENGSEAHLFMCRYFILVQSIYTALVFTKCIPVMYESSLAGGLIWTFLGLAPLMVGVYVMIMTMPLAIHVSSAGPFRQPEKITHVMRAAKTRQAVKLLMTLYELRSQLSKAGSVGEGEDKKNVSGEEMDKAIENLDPQRYAALSKAFDNYDDDGSGEIESSELIALMASLGNHLDDVQAQALLKVMDVDGDGTVSKKEFMHWHACNTGDSSHTSIVEAAEQIFKMFDDDGSGSINYDEFKEGLVKFKIELTDEDLQILVRELDADQSGSIELEEFTELLTRHQGGAD